MPGIDLRNCRIVAADDRAGWVDQAVLDLADCVGGTIHDRMSQGAGAVVLVGKEVVRAAGSAYPELHDIGLDGLSDQGFVLTTVRSGQTDLVVCTGGGSRGDAYAVIELIKAVEKTERGDFVEPMARREEPFFIRRGMYAHQHWAYAYPYSLRTWKIEDWRGYLDLLAYIKINLFQIWSMAGILPNPLSDGDRAYLENYHRVIDYAKNRRGMEVYIGECANNVAEHDGGKPVAERDYFDVEVLKDPADPREVEDIMANRRNLYSIASNADGYWIIDSDPGGWNGSPVSEFVDIFIGNRKLIDEVTEKGPNAKLAYWMWYGWAKGTPIPQRREACREAVEDMRERLKEPWILLACNETHLGQINDLGYVDKTIFFPYGRLEHEPSQPFTRLRFDELYDQLNLAVSTSGIRSVMGNAQTPYVQLPNMFFFAEAAWQGLSARTPDYRDVLDRLARLVAPDAASLLVECWLALTEPDTSKAMAIARQIAELGEQNRIGRIGPLGARYEPGVERLFSDLAEQLLVHVKAGAVINALENKAAREDIAARIDDYAGAWFAWQRRHGFSRRANIPPDSGEIAKLWPDYRQAGGFAANYEDELRSRLISQGLKETAVDVFMMMFTADKK